MAAAKPDDNTAEPEHTGLSRVVFWSGIALGTAFAIMMLTNGITPPKIGGMPAFLGVAAGGLIAFLLIITITVLLTEMTRRHHKTVWRAGRRYGSARYAGAKARASRRWEARRSTDSGPGLMSRIRARISSGDDGPAPVDTRPASAPTPKSAPASTHTSGSTAAAPSTTGGTPVATSDSRSRVRPGRRAQHVAKRIPLEKVPGHWLPVIAMAADLDPESDEALLNYMNGEILGAAALAEALTDAHSHLTRGLGWDEKSLQLIHDVAEAMAIAAQTMNGAKNQFTDWYDRPREFAAEGGLLPHDGRQLTGEGS